jgi:ribonuclease HI
MLQDTLWFSHETLLEAPTEEFQLYFDGGARGNPGAAGSGWLILKRKAGEEWQLVSAGYKYYVRQTNNFAEYCAAWLGLKAIININKTKKARVEILGDSHLVLQQIRGRWKIQNGNLKSIHASITSQLHQMRPSFRHVRRAKNQAADFLANVAMDYKATNDIEEIRKRKSQIDKLQELIRQDHKATEEATTTTK